MRKSHQINKRRLFFTSLFTAFMIFSMILNVGLVNWNNSVTDTTDGNLMGSAAVDNPWIVAGLNRTVRSYIQKDSSAINQVNEFNVTVPATTTSKLNSANLNFTFAPDYDTNYTLEEDSTLYYPRWVNSSRSNPYWNTNEAVSPDEYDVEVGSVSSGTFTYLVDDSTGSSVDIDSVGNVVNVTYNANFSKIVKFDRTKAQSIRYHLYSESSSAVSVKIFAYNFISSTWVQLNSSTWGTAKLNRQFVTINTCLMYINTNNITQLKFQFTAASPFNVKLYDLRVESLFGLEQDISKSKFAALEFDIKGNATIYGFSAWIRTMSSTITNANLTVSLFRANQTATRANVISASKIALKPGVILISSINITNYLGDGVAYFPFKSNFEGISLNVSNYFIVLSSNVSTAKYSIATLPYSDGDGNPSNNEPNGHIDHLFLKSDNMGATWTKLLTGGYQVDAAPFILNLTRAWIPTDLNMSISNKPVSSYTISTGIYATTSGYTWGLGQWRGAFVNKTEDVNNNVTIKVNYTSSLTTTLHFDVSYNVTVFSVEEAVAQFNVTEIEDPKWNLNYTLNQAKYTGWSLKNFTFVIPKNWDAYDLIAPNKKSCSDNVTYITDAEANYLGVDYSRTIRYIGNGNYSLSGYSTSYIYSTSTALHYKDFKWSTHGLMQGDNISIGLSITNETDIESYVVDGDAICELYDINGALVGSATKTDSTIDSKEEDDSLLVYTFNDEDILKTTTSTPQGQYSVIYKWTNGLQIGYERINIFITEYDPEILDIFLDKNYKTNVIMGSMNEVATDMPNYNVTIFNINETTGNSYQPESWYINKTLDQYYSDSMITLTSIMMNESIINLGEKVRLNVSLQSYNDWWSNDVKIGIQFVQLLNNEWIVMEQNSTEFEINKTGAPNDQREIEFVFNVPSDLKGVNAPIRQNSLKMLVTLWINEIQQETFDPFINATLVSVPESTFEGHILGYKFISGASGPTILSSTNRSESVCPGTTTYLLQVFDGYYVATPTVIKQTFNSKMMSKVVDLATKQAITWGRTFNLTGNLQDEFGEELSGKTVSVQYYEAGNWHNMMKVGTSSNTLTTTTDGTFEGEFNSSTVIKSSNLLLNISWTGDSNSFSTYTTKSLSMITYLNQIKVSIVNYTDYPYILKGSLNQIIVRIDNTGNSSIYQLEFIAKMQGASSITATTLSPPSGFVLTPGQSRFLEFNFNVPLIFEGDTVIITVNTTAIVLPSNELFEFQKSIQMNTLEASFLDNLDQTVITFTLLGIIALCVLSVLYAIRTNKELNKVPEPSVQKGTRGRYIDVKELEQKQADASGKKESKDKSESKFDKEESKKTNLDDLLKEEGLDKDKSE
jgi:hypothetical protein